jgi:hypothetical protein
MSESGVASTGANISSAASSIGASISSSIDKVTGAEGTSLNTVNETLGTTGPIVGGLSSQGGTISSINDALYGTTQGDKIFNKTPADLGTEVNEKFNAISETWATEDALTTQLENIKSAIEGLKTDKDEEVNKHADNRGETLKDISADKLYNDAFKEAVKHGSPGVPIEANGSATRAYNDYVTAMKQSGRAD